MLALSSLALGCGSFGAVEPGDASPGYDDGSTDTGGEDDAVPPGGSDHGDHPVPAIPLEELIEPCAPEATLWEVAMEVEVLHAYQSSMHELIVCGGLTVELAASIYTALFDAWFTNELAPPPGLTFQDGAYVSVTPGVTLSLRAHYPAGLEGHAEGAWITHDLFDTENYLVNASSEIDHLGGRVTVWFDGPGPLVELLGRGTEPTSPLVFELADLAAAYGRFDQIRISGSIDVYDVRHAATVRYEAAVNEQSVNALLSSVAMAVVDAEAFDGTRTLDVTSWDLDYAGQQLQGEVAFETRGGIPYDGTLTYDGVETYGEYALDCIE